jgi:hypothetical protein
MRRNLYIGLGVFGVLLIYVLFTQTGDRGYNTLHLPALPKIPADQMSIIEIVRPDAKVVLALFDKQWRLTEPYAFPAEPARVDNLRRMLAETRLTDLIAERPGAEADYGLTSATAVRVRVKSLQDKTLELTVGKSNAAGTHSFVSLEGKPAVYQALGDLAALLATPAADWRSLRITDLTPEDIRQVTLTRGKRTLVLDRTSEAQPGIVPNAPQGVTPAALPARTVWKAAGSDRVLNENKVSAFVTALAHLNGTRILDGVPVPAAPAAVVRFTAADGEHTLEFLSFETKAKKVRVRRADLPAVYEIEEYQGRQILPELKDLE